MLLLTFHTVSEYILQPAVHQYPHIQELAVGAADQL